MEDIKKYKWDDIIITQLGKRICGEIKSREIIFLCALGNLVKNADSSSFNSLVHSESSAGKDYLVKNTLKLFNPYKIISRTRISKTALNYWKPWLKDNLNPPTWDEKVLYLQDASEEVLNCEALKLMCSDGSFITITNKKNPAGYEDIEILGKPVVIITTANSTPNKEILNRFGVVRLDESSSQTKKIHNFVPEEYDQSALEFISKLKPCNVKITKDMRRKISDVFPTKLLRERRNFNRFLDFIKVVTVFYQEDKVEYNGKKLIQNLVADWNDYDVAKEIFMNLYCGVSEFPLNTRQKEIIKIIDDSNDPLEVQEIHNNLINHLEIQNLRIQLHSLKNLGVIQEVVLQNKFNRFINKYIISEEFSSKSPIKLPHYRDIINNNNNIDKNDKNDTNGLFSTLPSPPFHSFP